MADPAKKISRRPMISAVILVAGLILFSAIAAFQTRQMQWPVPKAAQNLIPHPITPHPPDNSTLFVLAREYFPDVLAPEGNHSTFELPIAYANVTVYKASVPEILVTSKTTGYNGQLSLSIPAGNYRVSLSSSITNLTAPVVTHADNTTELDIFANETSYSSASFVIENIATPNLILPWETILLKLNLNPQTINDTHVADYLIFLGTFVLLTNSPNSTEISLPFFQQIGANVIGTYRTYSQASVWLLVQPNSVVNITNVSNIDFVTVVSSYSTREYATTNST
jgi:hypothetical protein